MAEDILQQVRDMQHRDRSGAEALLLSFIQQNFPLDVVSLELTPLAVSLNSFNGFLTLADGTRRFFKSHTETDSVIDEYYNATMLAEAGYPVIQPVFSSTEPGKQLLVYEVIDSPSVFDIAWEIENTQSSVPTDLRQAQEHADRELFRIYQTTLERSADTQSAPIHQLFFHRLTAGRLDRFYGFHAHTKPVQVQLPGQTVEMSQIWDVRWAINGQEYQETLADMIEQAIERLDPVHPCATIVGHGDAHNGNVFLHRHNASPSLLYFDPAFAGRHNPLLDLVKPLFHNVFAMWMYYPQQKRDQLSIEWSPEGHIWKVNYQYNLHPVRIFFLESKINNTLIPILRLLQDRDLLPGDWRQFLKSALFCCPLLTMNLTEHERFPPEISLLGLAMAVEMAGEGHGQRSVIDQYLDRAEHAIQADV